MKPTRRLSKLTPPIVATVAKSDMTLRKTSTSPDDARTAALLTAEEVVAVPTTVIDGGSSQPAELTPTPPGSSSWPGWRPARSGA